MKHYLRFSSFWVILWVLCNGPLALNAQSDYYYDLNGGISCSTPAVQVVPTDPNLTFSLVSRGAGLGCQSATGTTDGGYNTDGYSATRTANDYIEFSVTTDGCHTATVNTVSLKLRRSGTGPTTFAFTYQIGAGAETDATGFSSAAITGTGTNTYSISIAQSVPTATTIRFRVYSWGASSAAGTLRMVAADANANRTSLNITTTAAGPALPVAPTSTSPGCTDVQVSYTSAQITGLPANVVYYWQGTNSIGTSTATPFTNPGALSQTVTSDGTYYIRARNTVLGCWSTTSRAVTVNVLADGGTAGLWTGAEDADWNNCRNWSDGNVPGLLANVSITGTPTNLPNNIPDFTILNSLTLNENAVGNTQLDAAATLTLNTLTLTNGKLNLNGGNVSIASELPGAISGGNTNAYIYNGTLNRGVWSAAGNTVYSFPVGDATRYRLLRYTQTNVRNPLDLVSVRWNNGAYSSPTFNGSVDGFTEFSADFKYDFQEGTWNLTSNFGNDAFDLEVFPNWASSTWCGGGNCDAYTLLKASGGTFNNGASTPVAADGGAWDTNPTPGASNGISAAGGIKRTGFTSFSDILVLGAANQPFPVEMLSFTGEWQGSDAVLTWRTAQETNNLGFVIERSINSQDFSEVGFVPAAGSQNSIAAYTFTDASPVGSDVFYYRLRQLDFDGAETYTAAIELQRSVAPRLVLYPNPTTASLTLDAQGIDLSASASVEVFSADGRRILCFMGSLTQVAEDVQRHFGHLVPGWYSVRLVANGFVLQQAVSKQ